MCSNCMRNPNRFATNTATPFAYNSSVLVRVVAAEAGSFRTTRQNYGQRKLGEVFIVHKDDVALLNVQ